MTGIIDTLKQDAKSTEAFLEQEGEKLLIWAGKAEAPVKAAFQSLLDDAKAQATPLVQAAKTAMADELSNVEADFETAILNLLQKVSGGKPVEVFLSSLGASGIAQLEQSAASLVAPLFVKVISSLASSATKPAEPPAGGGAPLSLG